MNTEVKYSLLLSSVVTCCKPLIQSILFFAGIYERYIRINSKSLLKNFLLKKDLTKLPKESLDHQKEKDIQKKNLKVAKILKNRQRKSRTWRSLNAKNAMSLILNGTSGNMNEFVKSISIFSSKRRMGSIHVNFVPATTTDFIV